MEGLYFLQILLALHQQDSASWTAQLAGGLTYVRVSGAQNSHVQRGTVVDTPVEAVALLHRKWIDHEKHSIHIDLPRKANTTCFH